jgi:hypothetical protein
MPIDLGNDEIGTRSAYADRVFYLLSSDGFY